MKWLIVIILALAVFASAHKDAEPSAGDSNKTLIRFRFAQAIFEDDNGKKVLLEHCAKLPLNREPRCPDWSYHVVDIELPIKRREVDETNEDVKWAETFRLFNVLGEFMEYAEDLFTHSKLPCGLKYKLPHSLHHHFGDNGEVLDETRLVLKPFACERENGGMSVLVRATYRQAPNEKDTEL